MRHLIEPDRRIRGCCRFGAGVQRAYGTLFIHSSPPHQGQSHNTLDWQWITTRPGLPSVWAAMDTLSPPNYTCYHTNTGFKTGRKEPLHQNKTEGVYGERAKSAILATILPERNRKRHAIDTQYIKVGPASPTHSHSSVHIACSTFAGRAGRGWAQRTSLP